MPTGNTEKVALRFQDTFKKIGWECDAFKVDADTDFTNLPFNYQDYDFLCIGSPVIFKLPSEEVINLLSPPRHGGPPPADFVPPKEPVKVQPVRLGPDAKKGVAFAT